VVEDLLVRNEPAAILAASTALTMGSRKAFDFLAMCVTSTDGQAEKAAATLYRAVEPAEACVLHAELFQSKQSRASVKAAGSAGIPEMVPFLLECMGKAELARIAGDALRAITGLDLMQAGLTAPAESPEGEPNEDPNDENVDINAEEAIPRPNFLAVTAWWRSHAQHFRPQTRYLAGVAVTDNSLNSFLKTGPQILRAAAADLAAVRGRPWFDVGAPAFRQLERLAHEAVWR
jgi:uncharacterized protein (TIGR02270 family)